MSGFLDDLCPDKCNFLDDSVRTLNKENNENERCLLSHWYREQIDLKGTKIIYYVADFDLEDDEYKIRGEDTTSKFSASAAVFL